MLDHGTLHLYFAVGASAMQQLREGLRAAGAQPPSRILDLPSGYGRVLRHMRAEWPHAQFTAMELQHEGALFCERTFGARPVLSRVPLWTVDAGDGYDLLWSGSLLTHVDCDAWAPILTYFRDRLRPGGTLVFTTHGVLSIALLAGEPLAVEQLRPLIGDYGLGPGGAEVALAARTTGFAFATYPASDDAQWGLSVSTPAWVAETVRAIGGLELVRHVACGWFGHHDVWTFRRSPS
jgi:SAM-dependent methyltransferase